MSKYRFYIGRYTKNDIDKGISLVEFDPEKRKLEVISDFWCGSSPSFLLKRGNVLYAANETDEHGAVSVCNIDPENGFLTFLGEASVLGMHTCQIAATGNLLYAANYSSGSLFGVQLLPDGSFGAICSEVSHTGSSTNPNRQEKAHAHSVNPDPTGERLIVADLGMDKLMIYRIDYSTGALIPDDTQPCIDTPPGEGPRHIVFHPSGNWLYVVTELGLNVLQYRITNPGEPYILTGTYSLLNDSFTSDDTAADIHLSPDGKYLYSSVRGKNVIALFEITAEGTLEWLGTYPSFGESPRNFCITDDGKYILIAHDRSGDVVVCPIQKATGILGNKLDHVILSGASCVIQA